MKKHFPKPTKAIKAICGLLLTMILIVVVLAVIGISHAFSADLRFAWRFPDPSAPSNSVTGFRLLTSSNGGPFKVARTVGTNSFGPTTNQAGIVTNAYSAIVSNLTPGVWTVRITATNMWGLDSDADETELPPAKPGSLPVLQDITVIVP